MAGHQRERRRRDRRSAHPIATAAAAALALVLAVVAAACGGSSTPSGSASTGADGRTTASNPATAATHDAVAGRPRAGGTLTMALESETAGGYCIPEAQLAASGQEVMNAVYDPLMALGADFTPRPYLARSVTADAAAEVFTITLRPGITFHDGSPLTAQVVADNLNVWIGDPATLARTGRHPLLFPMGYTSVRSVRATGPLTVTVAMSHPWPAFPDTLAAGRAGIMAEAQLNASPDDCATQLDGTGPFRLVSWDRGSRMVLERNPHYWMTDAAGVRLPYLSKLIFIPVPSSQDRYDALAGGTVGLSDLNTQALFDRVRAAPDRFNWAMDTAGHREVEYGLLNLARAPFDDRAVRLAVIEGIDRDRLNQIENEGRWQLADGPYDTGVMGFVAGASLPRYDPAAARAVLEPRHLTFRLSYVTDPYTKRLVDEIQREMAQVGVTVQVDDKDQSTIIDQSLAGQFDMIWFRNHPGMDPDGQYLWFHSGSPVNFGRISDPAIDRAEEDGRVNTDAAARTADYRTVARRFATEGYELWFDRGEWMYAADRRVHGFANYALPDHSPGAGINWGWSYLTGVWVD